MSRNARYEVKVTFRNVWTGATFIVIGKEAAKRMDELPSWRRV